jgi:hypothetical protein
MLFRKSTESAGVDAVICHIDILIPDIRDDWADHPLALLVCGSGNLPDALVMRVQELECILITHPVSPENIPEKGVESPFAAPPRGYRANI